jgi:YidC/Oxa1 family membrane protein insertase
MLAVLWLSNVLFPLPRQPDQGPDGPVEEAEAVPIEEDESEPIAAGDPDLARPPADAAPQAADLPLELATLGSVDPTGRYSMLVTLTSHGAAVDRIELASPRFRDEHDHSGYMGHVLLSQTTAAVEDDNAEPGAVVAVVGAGTPAAEAGLEVGDRIVGLSAEKEHQIASTEELNLALATTEPGQEITLQVVRGDGPPQAIDVKLRRRPLEVIRPEIENVQMRNGEVPPDFEGPSSFLMSLHSIDGVRLEGATRQQIDAQLRDATWEIVERNDDSVTFRSVVPELQLEFIKRYSIKEVPEDQRENHAFPGYDLDMDVEIRNASGDDRNVAYVLSGPNGLPIEGWWFAHRISHSWSAAGLRDVVVRFQDSRAEQVRCSTIADDKADPMGQGASLAYAAVDAQYFAAALIPQKESLGDVWFDSTMAYRVGPRLAKDVPKMLTNVSFELQRQSQQIAAGASLRDSYTIFAGPKRPELLEQYYVADAAGYNLSDLVYYGWFGTISKFLLLVLHFFYSWVGNYGIAIMMLTVAVRTIMFPLSLKQTKSMARMQALKPELDRINEKHKNDAQKKQEAMQELYRKHNINPLSGCLPMFIQLPIFMGLYRGLMIDVELRQSALFPGLLRWCSNLAAPDMFYDWSWFMFDWINSGIGMFGLGPYLNILPLVTVGLFLVSQQMFMPEPTNEQARMQQSMMKYMTLFMGLIFYKVASGLCLYFIVSSLWGILERKLLPKATPAVEGAATKGQPPASGGSGDGPRPSRGDGSGSPPRNGSPKRKHRHKVKRKK